MQPEQTSAHRLRSFAGSLGSHAHASSPSRGEHVPVNGGAPEMLQKTEIGAVSLRGALKLHDPCSEVAQQLHQGAEIQLKCEQAVHE